MRRVPKGANSLLHVRTVNPETEAHCLIYYFMTYLLSGRQPRHWSYVTTRYIVD